MRAVIVTTVVTALVLLGVSGAPGTTASVVVTLEDWHSPALGASDVPAGWSELPFPQRLFVKLGSLAVIEDEGQRALRLTTDAGQHTIIRKKIRVDIEQTPILEWRWKVVGFPVAAHLRDRSRSDSPAVLALAWRQPPRVVSYAWDVTEPVGSRFDNPKQPRVHYIVVRSGTGDGGRWLTERRDIAADYRAVFHESPASGPEEIELSVDSNDTRSTAETLVGRIAVMGVGA